MRSTLALQAAYDGMVAAGFGQGDELAAPKVQPRPQVAIYLIPCCIFVEQCFCSLKWLWDGMIGGWR